MTRRARRNASENADDYKAVTLGFLAEADSVERQRCFWHRTNPITNGLQSRVDSGLTLR